MRSLIGHLMPARVQAVATRASIRESKTNTTSDRLLRRSDYLLLAIAASYWPLETMATNLVGIAHPERLILLILVAWVGTVGMALGLTGLGMNRSTAVYTTFLASALLMSGGRVMRVVGEGLGWVLILTVISLATVGFHRLRDSAVIRAVIVGVVVALISGPAVAMFESWQGGGGWWQAKVLR